MVNLGKRMRKLKPLLAIRSGNGAALLPTSNSSSPQPRLSHVHLRFPIGPFNNTVHGARLFWRNHLRRLKYYNPALHISVEHKPGDSESPMTLKLTFEGTDAEALRALPNESEILRALQEAGGRLARKEQLTENEKEELARQQTPNWRNAPRELMTPEEVRLDEQLGEHTNAAEMNTRAEFAGIPTVDDDKVVLKVQELEPPTPAGEQTQAPIYMRSVTLKVKDLSANQIWDWFKMRTNSADVPQPAEDANEFRELALVFKKSAADRERVKRGIDERKANDEMLRRARGEVEKLRAEA